MTPRCPTCGQSRDAPSMFEFACTECLDSVEPLTDEEIEDVMDECMRDAEALIEWPWGCR